MATAKATEAVLDFTNVKEGGGNFNKLRQRAGGYKAKIVSVVDAPAKGDKVMQWLYTIQVGSGTYPYYCKHIENQYWKIRNIFTAAGIQVPKKRVKVNPNLVVGKTVGVILEDDEYDGKLQSNVNSIIPVSEIGEVGVDDDDDDDDDDDEDTPPVAKVPTKTAKKKPAPVEDDDDDDEDDDDDDEDETPPPAPKKKKKPVVEDDDDDDLESIEIEDL